MKKGKRKMEKKSMNKVAKAGAIVSIIGSAFMVIFAIVLVTAGGFLSAIGSNVLLGLGIVCLILGVANIVFSSLALAGHNNFRIAGGITAIVSIFLGWAVYVFPAILLLVGGILLLCGKTTTSTKKTEETVEIQAIQPEIQA